MAPNDSEKKKLVVIGDWLFDENWVTGEHRGATSSHIGGDHLRALHEYGNSLCRLAGAGQAACFLSCALSAEDLEEQWTITAAGVWDDCDTEAITALLGAGRGGRDSHSPYRITRAYQGSWANGTLFNIGNVIQAKLLGNPKPPQNEDASYIAVERCARYVSTGNTREVLKDWTAFLGFVFVTDLLLRRLPGRRDEGSHG